MTRSCPECRLRFGMARPLFYELRFAFPLGAFWSCACGARWPAEARMPAPAAVPA